ncbi:MAG: hypothetical protein GY780_02065 [bacterium]|nr:hypothetical protein [bacterium]
MVSRILWAPIRLGPPLLSLLLALMLLTQPAHARSRFTPTDIYEGDPGDGVLDPGPEVDPDPFPIDKNDHLYFAFVTFVDNGSGNLEPVFHFSIVSELWPAKISTLRDRRWHNAP